MEQFGKFDKKKNKHLRAGGTNLPEPGQAAFKIGSEAGGVDRKITGRDRKPVFGNESNIRKQIMFDDQHVLDFGPADKQT